jgi:hypothetical protein
MPKLVLLRPSRQVMVERLEDVLMERVRPNQRPEVRRRLKALRNGPLLRLHDDLIASLCSQEEQLEEADLSDLGLVYAGGSLIPERRQAKSQWGEPSPDRIVQMYHQIIQLEDALGLEHLFAHATTVVYSDLQTRLRSLQRRAHREIHAASA